MRSEDDLSYRCETLVNKAQKVGLGTSVQGQGRFVKQYDDAMLGLLELTECREEAEEPLEAAGTLTEVIGEAVPTVLYPDLEISGDGVLAEVGRFSDFVHIDLDGQFGVLRPILENLFGQFVADGLQLRLALLEVSSVRASAVVPANSSRARAVCSGVVPRRSLPTRARTSMRPGSVW